MDMIKKLKKDGLLLREIPKKQQTKEICLLAIKQNPLALQFASKKCLNSEICLEAVKIDGRAFRYIPLQLITKEMCELAVEADPELLNNIPDDFVTPEICMIAIKKNVNTLSYIAQEKRFELFNDETEIDLIEKVVACNYGWLVYMPNRVDVRELCIRYMEADFSIAQYMPEQIKMSDDILDYQRSKGKLNFIKKYYDDNEKKLKVRIKVIYKQFFSMLNKVEKSYQVTIEFGDFNEFYNFLDKDLSDAELRNYDFKGIDLKKYNIAGAVIHSDILQSQGLYDGNYFFSVKQHVERDMDDVIAIKEFAISDGFYYPKPIEDEKNKKFDVNRIPFFYISDIHLSHRVRNKFKDKATKEEIRSYIKYLARKMVGSVGLIPYDSYLLIAGDTSSFFELSVTFYNELIQWWNPNRIIVVSGNHELWEPWVDIEENIEQYRNFFAGIGIIFLQNDLFYVENRKQCGIIHEKEILKMGNEEIRQQVQHSSIIILGGIGFSGLNQKFNASIIRFGKSFEELSKEEALQKDIMEAKRFNAIYTKILSALCQSRVIVMTHAKKEDWNTEEHNPYWIYINGHNHHNFYEVSDSRTIYADNQIGYRTKNIGLKYFYCDNDYDVFAYYKDGIYEITKEQYIEFNRGKSVLMSFDRKNGSIYMLKRNNIYMFVMYCMYSKRSRHKYLYLMNGGKLMKLRRNNLEDLAYYYENIEKYTENVKQLLCKYVGGQQRISEFIKHLGGSGKIHGCIVDVEKPNELEGFSYCHLFVNPIDGKVTPYFAKNIKSRVIYKDLKGLLQAHDSCKLIAKNYLQFERVLTKNLPDIQYSEQMGEWGIEKFMYDEGSYLYKISRIIKSLQYCTEKNIVRLWNEELLNYDFVTHIKQATQIKQIANDKLIIDVDNITD